MNKYIIGVIFFISLFVYASCLGESGNAIELSEQPVVVQLGTDPEMILYSGGGVELIPSSTFQASTGESYTVNYKIDFDASENKNDDGIYHVTVVGTPKFVELYPMAESFTDTSTILPNERTMNTIQKRFGYVRDRLFLYTEYPRDTVTIINRYDLSFKENQQGVFNEKIDAPVYELFLRAQKKEDGERVSARAFVDVNSFSFTGFVNIFGNKELDNGNDELHFVITYPKSFNSDTTKINWAQSDIFTLVLQ